MRGEGQWYRPFASAFTWDQMTQHLDDYRCRIVRGSFQETAPRKTAANAVKHHDGSVDWVVRDGGERSVVVTTPASAFDGLFSCTVPSLSLCRPHRSSS